MMTARRSKIGVPWFGFVMLLGKVDAQGSFCGHLASRCRMQVGNQDSDSGSSRIGAQAKNIRTR